MKILGFVSFLFIASLASANASTTSSADELTALLAVPVTSAQPCSYWNYNTNGGGYICQSYQFGVQIPDGYAVNSELANMNERIRRLEAKIGALEAAAAQK